MPPRRPKSTYGRFSRGRDRPGFDVFEDESAVAARRDAAGEEDPFADPVPGSELLDQDVFYDGKSRTRTTSTFITKKHTAASQSRLKEKSTNHPLQKPGFVSATTGNASRSSSATIPTTYTAKSSFAVEVPVKKGLNRASNTAVKENTKTSDKSAVEKQKNKDKNKNKNKDKAKEKDSQPKKAGLTGRRTMRVISIGDVDAVQMHSPSGSANTTDTNNKSWMQGVVSSAKKAAETAAERFKTLTASPSPRLGAGAGGAWKAGSKYVKIRGKENQVQVMTAGEKKEKARVSFAGNVKPPKDKTKEHRLSSSSRHKRTSSTRSVDSRASEDKGREPGKKLRHVNTRVSGASVTSIPPSAGAFNDSATEDELARPNGSYSFSYDDIAKSSPVAHSTPKDGWNLNSTRLDLLAERFADEEEPMASIDGRLEAYNKLDGTAGVHRKQSSRKGGAKVASTTSTPSSSEDDLAGYDDGGRRYYDIVPARKSSISKRYSGDSTHTVVKKSARTDLRGEEDEIERGRKLKRSNRNVNLVSAGCNGVSMTGRKDRRKHGGEMMAVDEVDELGI